MNNKKKNSSLQDLVLRPVLDSNYFTGQKRLKNRKGFIDFKVLILIAVLILIILMLFF